MIDHPDGLLPILIFDDETNWSNLLQVASSH